MNRIGVRAGVVCAVSLGLAVSMSGIGAAAPQTLKGAAAREMAASKAAATYGADDESDLIAEQAQYGYERTAPGSFVPGGAQVVANKAGAALPVTGGPWQDMTTVPYNAEPANYTDPFWSNVGAGFRQVGGRTTAVAQTPDGTWFAGTADGGVWRSYNQGSSWTPVFDSMPSLSIGAMAVDPVDGSLWVGTGEANVSQDSYAGTGVYRSTDDGQSFQRIGNTADGNNPISSRTVFKLAFDQRGNAYAATDNGLFRYAASTGQWTEVLDPIGPVDNPPYDQQVTSVAVVPGSAGTDVIAAIGWHGPGNTEYNGFYESTDSGSTFHQVTVTGDIRAADIGRTTFAYSADGTKLYAIVQSLSKLAAGDETALQGIFVSSGSPASVAGPWTKVAGEAKLAASGSALKVGSGYGVGVQAWYNQDLAVDPANPDHVYAGLEEVFESTNAGSTWNTASPYWNYGLACGSACPPTTHPDQHAMMIADGKIVIGNDGGVYSRPVSDDTQYGDWTDLNATLESWQYYDARAGKLGTTGLGIVGGLQDNGTSVIDSGHTQMVEPAGGDGFDVVVDPSNANHWVGEYTDGTEYLTQDGGHSFYDTVSPTCVAQETVGITPRSDCDPSARFVTPLTMDQTSSKVWLTGGQYVWETTAGFNTSCTDSACTWKPVFNTGSNNAVTALASTGGGKVIYAGFVSGGGNPGPTFSSGIATNYGGTWHLVNMTGLPDRYLAGLTVDPNNPAHAYAVFNGYSRRWIPGGGVGHVFETLNGGRSWINVSGNLPDIASDALVIANHKLALATDLGVYTATSGQEINTKWSRLGTGLPNAAVDDITMGPDGYIYAATHGRGIWRIAF